MTPEDRQELANERFWAALDECRTLNRLRELVGSSLVALERDRFTGTQAWWIAPGERVLTCEACERVLYEDETECACLWHQREEDEDAAEAMKLAA